MAKRKALLIAEKPSLMRDIQNAYNHCRDKVQYDIDFKSQVGHLMELVDPVELNPVYKSWDIDLLPINPEKEGGWKYKVKKNTKDVYMDIQKAVKSGIYDVIIHAGDPDQEGELLINLTLQKIGNKLPVLRFWSNDTTQPALEKALQNLHDDSEGRFKNLYNAALIRQHSDWLFGINGSRGIADRIRTGAEEKIAAGRVMTCVQTIIVDREDEINNFVPSTSYGVALTHTNGLVAQLFEPVKVTTETEKQKADEAGEALGTTYFKTKAEAEDIISKLSDISTVKEVDSKIVKTNAPKLYKLASIQSDAAKYGYSSQDTLDIIQALYETHHYVSYPRTDCEVLSSNEDFANIISSAAAVPEYTFKEAAKLAYTQIDSVKSNKKYVNDKELAKHGHSALVPTTLTPDFSKLNEDEKLIYSMIARKFLGIFQPPLIQKKINVILENSGYMFKGTGKEVVDKGYTEFLGIKVENVDIPAVNQNEKLDVAEKDVTERTTTCPKRFTEGTIIDAMEKPSKYLIDISIKENIDNLTIGTSATRGEIIKKLIKDKYITVKKSGKQAGVIYPTDFGSFMIHTIRGISLCRVDTTGQWEQLLMSVRNGDKSIDEANAYMFDQLETLLADIKGVNKVSYGNAVSFNEKVMTCPGCGNDIIAGSKNYFCSGYKAGCKYSMMKKFCEAEFNTDDVKTLFTGGIIEKELTKKETGKKWKQLLKFNPELGKLEFVKNVDKETTWQCPECHEPLFINGKVVKCHECNFSIWASLAQHDFTEKELDRLFTKGSTHTIKDFVSKKGTVFSAKIKIGDTKDIKTGEMKKGLVFEFEKKK